MAFGREMMKLKSCICERMFVCLCVCMLVLVYVDGCLSVCVEAGARGYLCKSSPVYGVGRELQHPRVSYLSVIISNEKRPPA